MTSDVVKTSIRGITKEINRRTWHISGIILHYKGEGGYFRPAVRNVPGLIKRALKLHREVKKLEAIRGDLKKLKKQL